MSNEILKALELLKSKTWIDLTHTFGSNTPHFAMFELEWQHFLVQKFKGSFPYIQSAINIPVLNEFFFC